MRPYRLFGLSAAVSFAVVGLVFLFFPNSALAFFNRLSSHLGLPQAPLHGTGFYLILASAYMYVVTLLAYLMYRHPEQDTYPLLLAHGKLASSLVSIYLFLTHPYLIYLVNFAVDGLIGIAALRLMRTRKAEVRPCLRS